MANYEQDSPPDRQGEAENTMSIVLGIVGFDHGMDGFPLSTDHLTRVKLPSRLTPEDLKRMQTDFELLAGTLRDHPTEMAQLFEAHCRKDTTTSRRIAKSIGISEESFKQQGGGVIWAVVGALVVCDVFSGCLTSWAWNGI
jgi:hypothetical protein